MTYNPMFGTCKIIKVKIPKVGLIHHPLTLLYVNIDYANKCCVGRCSNFSDGRRKMEWKFIQEK